MKVFALTEGNIAEVAELTGRDQDELVRTLQTARSENKIVYIMYAKTDYWSQVRRTQASGKVLPFPDVEE